MKNLRKIAHFIRPYKKYAVLNVVFNILSTIFSLVSLTLVIPFLQLLLSKVALVTSVPEFTFSIGSLIEYFYFILSSIIIGQGKETALLFICLCVVVLFFLKNLFRYLAMYFIASLRNGVVKELRNSLLKKILILPMAFYSERRKGDIITRITSDVQEIEWSIMSSMVMIFRDPFTILFYLGALFLISSQLTLLLIILIPFTAYIISTIGKNIRNKSMQAQKKLGMLVSTIEETISGLRIIKAFNAISYSSDKFKNQNKMYARRLTSVYRRRDISSPLTEFLGALITVIIIWFGGNLVLGVNHSISAEAFIDFIVIFSQIIPPAKSLTDAHYSIQKGSAAVERILQIMDAEEVITEAPDALAIKEFKDCIEFRNVSFSYESETILKNVSLKIRKGKTVAVVGPSGSGKTTLINLLPRFYDCTEGEILIDGVPIKKLRIEDLRALFGLVTQENVLFNNTVRNNIAFGNVSISEEKIIEAAKIANAHSFIAEMEQGYETNIGDMGVKLSGGQRQRLCIARAVLKNPPVLLLDEATASLDTESERLVQEAINNLMKNRSSFIIAHRLSTIQNADEIIVLKDGTIAERGTHNDLIEMNGLYKRMYDLQNIK
ncbi:MAG: ABC transporter ATP-binding protein [Bacteroidales bacterium]